MSIEALQQGFLKDALENNIKTVYERQLQIFLDYVRRGNSKIKRSPEFLRNVENYLRHPLTQNNSAGQGFIAYCRYPIFIRFMDMKRIGNWKIYNRQVWGGIYRQTMKDVNYQYSTFFYEYIKQQMSATPVEV